MFRDELTQRALRRQKAFSRGSKRGVVFIRELVPRYMVAAIARWVFNENYSSVPMGHRIEAGNAEYTWTLGSGRCAMSIETAGEHERWATDTIRRP
jgi:hypothetical protein